MTVEHDAADALIRATDELGLYPGRPEVAPTLDTEHDAADLLRALAAEAAAFVIRVDNIATERENDEWRRWITMSTGEVEGWAQRFREVLG